MTRYLTLSALMRIARDACETDVQVRDAGLLESALARPQASVFGQDAYPSLYGKAAALMDSLINHALVDGNKRLGWATTAVFLWINGQDVRAPEDDAFNLVMAVAAGRPNLEKVAEQLQGWCVPLGRGCGRPVV